MKHVDSQPVVFDRVIDRKIMSSLCVVETQFGCRLFCYYWGKTDPVGRLLTLMTGEWRSRRIRNYPTQLCLPLDHMPVPPLSVPTSLAGSITTVQVGTFSRQLAVAGLR